MFVPEDLLTPPKGSFDEPWQATVLAMATAMIRAGQFSQSDWSAALGEGLHAAETNGLPDTNETYFKVALSVLEKLSETAGISSGARLDRKSEWESAYRSTPHGQPVTLAKIDDC